MALSNTCTDKDLTTEVNEVRIVIAGKSGVGKSALGNSLLQSNRFQSNNYGQSVTEHCEYGTRYLDNGKKMVVVDTPGIFDTRKKNAGIVKEVAKCIILSSPGPHIFIFVLKIGRFTPEEMDTIQQLKDLFGEDVMNYVIIVFTGKESLDFDGLTIDEQIENSPKDLRSLVDQCQGRIATINNRAESTEKAKDVEAILHLINKTVKKNSGGCYTNEMFRMAERESQEKLRRFEEEKNKAERELERQKREIQQKNIEIEKKEQENCEKKEEIKRIKNRQDEESKRKRQDIHTDSNRMKQEIENMKLENEEKVKELNRIKKKQDERKRDLEKDEQKIRDARDQKIQTFVDEIEAEDRQFQKDIQIQELKYEMTKLGTMLTTMVKTELLKEKTSDSGDSNDCNIM